MPIAFDPCPPVALKGHLVCFPAISQKTPTDDDPTFMKEIYEQYPAANYYTQHAAASTSRGKPGFYNIHSVGGEGNGVINMFIRLYAGNRVLSNDNLALRVKYFKSCTESLVACKSITRLDFMFPCKTNDDLKDYIQILEDFLATYKLNNGVELTIVIHHEAPKGRQSIVKKKPAPAAEDSNANAPLNTFRLVCDDSQINEQSLFEIDFVRYCLKD
jgi:hypothetical protein